MDNQDKPEAATKRNRRRPLPVTITSGMRVIELNDGRPGTICGFTQAYCIYRIEGRETLSVAHWRDLALGGIAPADVLLPETVTENDRRNASATVLRELLALKQFGLTPIQRAALEELTVDLCGENRTQEGD